MNKIANSPILSVTDWDVYGTLTPLVLASNELTILEKIQLAKQGDQSAFHFILNFFWNDLYGFLLKRTQNESDAEDITIETFAKAFNKIQTFDDQYSFKTWITTISKNIHVDLIRKRDAKTSHFEEVQEYSHQVPVEALSPEDLLISEQNLATLLTNIKKLKPHYQEVIQLRFFNELTYKEIASKTLQPIGNVKVKLLRAKKLLAEIIQNNQ
jgi:RNA polymerase sigma-70 factor (ECF subfamily)